MTVPTLPFPTHDVRAIAVRTNDLGPFEEDVHWLFDTPSGEVEIPGSRLNGEAVGAMHAAFPGLDSEKIVRAMTSVEPRTFRVWHPRAAEVPRTKKALEARFESLVTRLGGRDPGGHVGLALISAWSAPERRYHDTEHLGECLVALGGLNAPPVDRDVAELALFYHDAVYDPRGPGSEAKSQDLLRSDAKALGIPVAVADRAALFVGATAHAGHDDALTDPLAGPVLDADLSGLAREPYGFLDYEDGVREEYIHVPDAAFFEARGRFLRGLLAQGTIFRTARGRALYEQRARQNLEALLSGPRYALT
jgi:predicted metal-dependent HD superfamily phosphohydrolase